LESPIYDSWKRYCEHHGISFETHLSVLPPDDTTLFTTSGMQKHKPSFRDTSLSGRTVADVQRCLRLNDLAEIDDDHHHLVFHMMGLFSFRDWTVPQAIAFWHGYLRQIGVPLTHVTVHPDCLDEWSEWHRPYGLPVLPDTDCLWSDGGMGGYSTEFYVGHVEVGNIVNPLGTCIDVGFGLERLEQVTGRPRNLTGLERLRYTLDVLASSSVRPGPKGQGYVMRRLLRTLRERGGTWDHPLFEAERLRYDKQRQLYERMKRRHPDKDASWWWDTLGIDLTELETP
jgi:alanyl-tRNA synthetase